MCNWLILITFFLTFQLFATIHLSDRGYMNYDDFLTIQNNHNLLHFDNKFYQLEIEEEALHMLNKNTFYFQ